MVVPIPTRDRFGTDLLFRITSKTSCQRNFFKKIPVFALKIFVKYLFLCSFHYLVIHQCPNLLRFDIIIFSVFDLVLSLTNQLVTSKAIQLMYKNIVLLRKR